MRNDGIIIEKWTGENDMIKAEDKKILVAFDKPKASSTAGVLINHTSASAVRQRQLPFKANIVPQFKAGKLKSLQKQSMNKALRNKRRTESLSMLPGVIMGAKEGVYYVNVDAIATFAGVYYQVHWPTEKQINAVKTQTQAWLDEIEAANLFWYGEKEETSLGMLLAALIDVVGYSTKPKTDRQWTNSAAGMVLLMWAEMTQTKSSVPR